MNENELEFMEITDKVGVEQTIFKLYDFACRALAVEESPYQNARHAINVLICILHPFKDDLFWKEMKSIDKNKLSTYRYNYYRLRAVTNLLDRIGIGLEREQLPENFGGKIKKELIAECQNEI